MSGSFDSPAF